MRRARAALLVLVLTVSFAEAASAKTQRIKPADRDGSTFVFSTGGLRGHASDVVSARIVVGRKTRRVLSRATIRRAIRRGSIRMRVRRTGSRRVRLVVRVDERRPSRPTEVSSVPGPGTATITWGAARDDTGVSGYRIARGGSTVETAPATARSWTDSGLQPGEYRYTVRALDRADNLSRPSSTTVTVTAAGAPVQAPSTGGGVSPSGQSAPSGDLPGWRLRFSDDFTTNVPLGSFPDAVTSRWQANPAYAEGRPDTSGKGRYSPHRVLSVHDGMLDYWMHSEGGQPLVAAAVPQMSGQAYGRYAVRFRSDTLPGYKVAWLLWPEGTWPQDGEIDFPEGDLDQTICGYVHHTGATTGSDQDAWCDFGSFNPWHTAVIEWSPGLVQLILDDGAIVRRTTDRVPSGSMFWVLQSETSLGPGPSPLTQGHIYVDWVAAWSRG